jgi:hypothetical protein
MPRSKMGMPASVLVAVLTVASGCRPGGGVTARRIENAVAPTFANLIHIERSILGLPPAEASSLNATATCGKVAGVVPRGAASDASGGGNWTCTVVWFFPGHKAPLRDTYEVTVTTDGCYTATSAAAEGHLGGPTLTTLDGTTVTNLLYVFDGCFDTT